MAIISVIILSIFAVLGFSFTCAMLRHENFSMNVFLSSISIGIAILTWIPAVPNYLIVLSILIPVFVLFRSTGDETIE